MAWGGPVWGRILPLAFLGIARHWKWRRAWMAAFFAGFCLVANGAYLLGGSLYPVGDAEVLLREAAPRTALAGFGVAALALGIYLWNGLGSHFGMGRHTDPIDKVAAWSVTVAAVHIILVEVLIARL